jgi:L-alanine-DL-glutamate epimerase-like enolase superfamily enzyme
MTSPWQPLQIGPGVKHSHAGGDKTIMFDANQHWNLPNALRMCRELAAFKPLWIEEPTHPDDLLANVELSEAIAPVKIAAGEHISNRVLFKNFLKANAFPIFKEIALAWRVSASS